MTRCFVWMDVKLSLLAFGRYYTDTTDFRVDLEDARLNLTSIRCVLLRLRQFSQILQVPFLLVSILGENNPFTGRKASNRSN